MCLIIAGKSNQIRNTLLSTPNLIDDIYTANSDGIGAMYTTSKGKLRTPKLIPANVQQFAGFIRQLPNDERSIAIHARFKTHGAVDLENCHPYPVIEGRIAMMHNGVLSQGNKADATKSDTWHYIKDVVRPQLAYAPKLFLLPSWVGLVEEDITSSNRFVFMDNDGQMVIANRDTGIEHDGMWFSNTYAWSPELLIPGYHRPKKSYALGHWKDFDYDYGGYYAGDTQDYGFGPAKSARATEEEEAELAEEWADNVWDAISECDPDYMTELLTDRPYLTLRTLYKDNEFVCSVDAATELSKGDYDYVKLLEDEAVVELAQKILVSVHHARKIAEVACWYGDWMGKPINARDNDLVDQAEAVAAAAAAVTTEAANEAYAG